MAKKRIRIPLHRASQSNKEKEQYLKLNPNAAGLTFGAVSFVLSIILVISINLLGENSPLNAVRGIIILFIISAFIEGTILGYIIAWVYNKFIYISK